MTFQNVYEDETRAASYARLDFPGTYYLAYRDLPAILRTYGRPGQAVDFGCGTGRSTRFLRTLGYTVIGVDVSEQMIGLARELDAQGDYRLVRDADYDGLGIGAHDLVLAVFTFDNIPGVERRVRILSALRRLLRPGGIVVLVDSTPELYVHDWASFSCREFAHNHVALSGQVVSTRMKDVEDARPVEDLLWLHEDYLALFAAADLQALATLRPLALAEEPFEWVNETRVPPWVIYVLEPATSARGGVAC